MKNIHLIPTPNPSRLVKIKDNLFYTTTENIPSAIYQNIYITNSEEIKEGDWYLGFETNYSTEPKERWVLYNCVSKPNGDYSEKIILTTDQDLIKDGVQEIDDEFLEWFVKNPSCEEVEIGEGVRYEDEWIDNEDGGEIFQHQYCCYKISIPKEEPKQIKCYCGHTSYCDCSPLEEPKQETLEEAAEKYAKQFDNRFWVAATFKEGAKWQQERMYSEEEVIEIAKQYAKRCQATIQSTQWLTEQFKKK